MGADVVAALGPLGQLSVSKLTSYLPKFGTQTLNIINTLTSNPIKENLSLIPKLSGNSDNYKDFKVIFNGNVTSPTSIKTFKWLSQCDTSEIQNGSLKDQVKTGVDAIKQTGQNNIQDVKKSVEDVKNAAKTTAEDVRNQVQKTKDSIQECHDILPFFEEPVNLVEDNPLEICLKSILLKDNSLEFPCTHEACQLHIPLPLFQANHLLSHQ